MDTIEKFDIFAYEQNFADGQCLIREGSNMIYLYEEPDEYGKQVIPDDPEMVCCQKTYYADTLQLKSEGFFLKRSQTQIGIWKTYDTYGKLEDQTDYDVEYPIKWNEIKTILKINDIDICQVKRIWRQITKEGRPEWRFMMNAPRGTMEIYRFDATNGELIEKEITQLKPQP